MTAQALRILVVGAGNRGRAYTRALVQLDYVKICGVVDPNKVRRGKLIEISNNDSSIVPYDDWQSAVNDADNYDGVLICVLDDLHREVAVAFAAKGKHMLCEKPLATTWSDCKDICDAVVQNNLLLACGHVLRYSPHNLEMKKLLDQGVVGDIININHTEPVGWYHFAHSYVRGNWKRKDTTTFSLMAKCCHDIDLLMWLLGSDNIRRVSSFGSLSYFRKDRKPAEAGDATRCLSCQNEPSCAYSAKKIYLDEFKKTGSSFITHVMPDIENEVHIMKALEETPYGSCVFESDNDVCDHQVVNLDFGSASATMTMIAFSELLCERKICIYGTKGELTTDSTTIRIFDFATQKTTTITPPRDDFSGHGDGDKGLATGFAEALKDVIWYGKDVASSQKKYIRCTPQDMLNSHKIVFLAEQSRLNSTVESIDSEITI